MLLGPIPLPVVGGEGSVPAAEAVAGVAKSSRWGADPLRSTTCRARSAEESASRIAEKCAEPVACFSASWMAEVPARRVCLNHRCLCRSERAAVVVMMIGVGSAGRSALARQRSRNWAGDHNAGLANPPSGYRTSVAEPSSIPI